MVRRARRTRQSGRASAEFYISRDDHRVLRTVSDLYFEGWSTGWDAEGAETFGVLPVTTRTTTDYFDHNVPIAIELPD